MPEEHPAASGDLPPEVFRRHAHEVADWIADFLEGVGDLPVLPRVEPGDVTAALPADPPADPEPLEDVLRDFREIIVPGTTHWNHPRFHAYFNSSGSGPGILGEALAAALNVNAMVWRSGPAPTELETVSLDWLRRMLGLPEGFHGHIEDTASTGNLVALAAAREFATGGEAREKGLAGGPRLRVYASEEAHSSVRKAAIVLGLGAGGVRDVPTDDAFRMRPDALEEALAEDRAAGWTPMAVSATVGTTSTTSIDPVPALADVCEREGIWLHVDAAYGGAMGLVPEYRHVLQGCERADSFVVNPHKWMFVPIDLSAVYSRRPDMVRRAFSLVPPYLMTPEDGAARNLMDYGPALGRRFRALKLWMVIRAFGTRGLAERIRAHRGIAAELAGRVDDAADWERMAPVPMGLVLLRHVPRPGLSEEELERHNRELMDTVNATGRAFLSHTLVRGRFSIRVAVGNLRTTAEDVAEVWGLLREKAEEVGARG